jgi:hypothetical protein
MITISAFGGLQVEKVVAAHLNVVLLEQTQHSARQSGAVTEYPEHVLLVS